MTSDHKNKIFDVLVEVGGVDPDLRKEFMHCVPTFPEFRIQGKLGYGGKFRSSNYTKTIRTIMGCPEWPGCGRVDCYPEDSNPERIRLIEEINRKIETILES